MPSLCLSLSPPTMCIGHYPIQLKIIMIVDHRPKVPQVHHKLESARVAADTTKIYLSRGSGGKANQVSSLSLELQVDRTDPFPFPFPFNSTIPILTGASATPFRHLNWKFNLGKIDRLSLLATSDLQLTMADKEISTQQGDTLFSPYKLGNFNLSHRSKLINYSLLFLFLNFCITPSTIFYSTQSRFVQFAHKTMKHGWLSKHTILPAIAMDKAEIAIKTILPMSLWGIWFTW